MLSGIQPIKSTIEEEVVARTGLSKFFSIKLINTDKFQLSTWDVIVVLVIIIIAFIVIKLIKKAIIKNKKIEIGKQYSLYSLIKYFLILITAITCLQTLGVKLSILLGGSAALLVGIGLGLQNLFSDFVSGIIILIDTTIKVGDVIDVKGLVCKVNKIHLRTTQVITRDNKYILLPNSLLTKNSIINWTHNNEISRFEINVGAGYDSDAELVRNILLSVVKDHREVLKNPKPFVRFNDFSDSFLLFTLYFWSKNVFRVENIKSDLRYKIYDEFNKYHIDISLPQRVVHLYEKERGDDFIRYTKDDFGSLD